MAALFAFPLLCMLFGLSSAAHTAPAPAPDCSSLVANMVDCLSYVTAGGTAKKPEGTCCSGLKTVVKTDADCICQAFRNSAQLGVTIDVSKALTLPAACHVSAPSLSTCALSPSIGAAPALSPLAVSPSSVAAAPTPGIAGIDDGAPAPAVGSSDAPMVSRWGSSLGSSDAINQTVDKMSTRLYEMTLDIWSDWLEINLNRTKTKLFFMSPSPFHLYGQRWEEKRNCFNETEPIFEGGSIGLSIVTERMKVAETKLQNLEARGIKIEYLNTTHLSEYRKDAHPSIYKNFFHTVSEEQLSNPTSYSDCTHWCLPGVPDVWNQILYSYIMNS